MFIPFIESGILDSIKSAANHKLFIIVRKSQTYCVIGTLILRLRLKMLVARSSFFKWKFVELLTSGKERDIDK